MNITERIDRHGGVKSYSPVPFRGRGMRQIGWHIVVVCQDGTRIGLSKEEEEALTRTHDR